MELDRAEAATQELLTAAEQLQKENTQLSAENEVCNLLGPKGCIMYCKFVTAHMPESNTTKPNQQHVVVYQSHGSLSGCHAQQANLIAGLPAVQSLKKELGSLNVSSKRFTEAQKQQNHHEGGASTSWLVRRCLHCVPMEEESAN